MRKNSPVRSNRCQPLLVVVTAVLMLAGCVNPSEVEPTATATDTATAAATDTAEPSVALTLERSFTTEQLAAALPTAEALGDVQSESVRCPGGERCEIVAPATAGAYVHYRLNPPSTVSAVEAETATSQAWVGPLVALSAYSFDSGEAAEAVYQDWADGRTPGTRPIDQPAFELDGAVQPGERGEGTVADLTLDDWVGVIDVQTIQMVSPDGDLSSDRFSVEAAVVSDKTFVMASMSVPAFGRTLDDAEDRIRQLLQLMVDNLTG